jgi:hypothetical protein
MDRPTASGRGLLGLLAVLIVLAYAVPYGLLRDIPSWQAAFLFWTLFGVAAVAVIIRLISGWRP